MKIKMFSSLLVALSLLLVVGFAERAEALLTGHECWFCHEWHGGTTDGLLSDVNSELVCLSCHNVSQINSETAEVIEAAAVHNPGGLNSDERGYITCRECHTPHDSVGGNKKLIGYKLDPEYMISMTGPAIRSESSQTLPVDDPIYRQVTFFDPATDYNIDDTFPGSGICEMCHDPFHNQGNDCTACHPHAGGFTAPSCTATGCHDNVNSVEYPLVDYPGRRVTDASPHAKDAINTSKGVELTCGDCHGGHSSTVSVPNNAAVGIHYDATGHNGIALGSSGSAPGSTEAEICWNCHDTYNISEWDTNTDTNGGANNYDFGYLSAGGPSWVGATWTSAETDFSYKSGTIESTHSVNSSVTGPGVDAVSDIRCSYCHDVHQLNLATGDSTSGKPYLRGSWMGNPYREDGAPFAGQTYASQGNFGAVPRGGTGATEMGGYQIDQNNGSPTSTWTLSGSAGLCILCHDEDSTGASVTVSTMNYFGTASTDWVGANGHANAVIGGNGTGSNIFNETDRKPSDGYCNPASGTDADSIAYNANGYCSGYPNMAYQHNSGTQAWGLRSTDSDGFSLSPSISARYPYNNYNWGATVDTGTTDSQYHEFSCSKCHNPHASRLPRLMMTNCLDTKHNSWDDPPPDTMLNGDTITISGVPTGGRRDCSADVNAAHTVDYLQMGSSIFLSSSFTTGCSNQDADILWNGTTYSLSGVTFVEPNEIQLDAADLASFVGREIPSTGSKNGNDAGAIYADNSEVTFSNATSAQNCHRVVDPDFSNAGGSGWNKVTPWTP